MMSKCYLCKNISTIELGGHPLCDDCVRQCREQLERAIYNKPDADPGIEDMVWKVVIESELPESIISDWVRSRVTLGSWYNTAVDLLKNPEDDDVLKRLQELVNMYVDEQ
jgi:hypothetical protein